MNEGLEILLSMTLPWFTTLIIPGSIAYYFWKKKVRQYIVDKFQSENAQAGMHIAYFVIVIFVLGAFLSFLLIWYLHEIGIIKPTP